MTAQDDQERYGEAVPGEAFYQDIIDEEAARANGGTVPKAAKVSEPQPEPFRLNDDPIISGAQLDAHVRARQELERQGVTSSLGVVGSSGFMTDDEEATNAFVTGEKGAAKSSHDFWSGARDLLAARRQNLNDIGDVDNTPIQDFLERKVQGQIEWAGQRQRFAEAMEQREVAGPTQGMWRSLIDSGGRALVGGVVGGTLKGIGAASTYLVADPIVDLVNKMRGADAVDLAPEGSALHQIGTMIDAKAKAWFPEDPARQFEFKQKVAAGAGSMVGFYGPSFAAQLIAKAGPAAMMALASTTGALSQSGNTLDSVTEAQNKNPAITERDRFKVWLGGLVSGSTEGLPLGHWLSGPQSGWVRSLLAEAFEEGGQEFGQTVLDNLVAQKVFDPDRHWDDNAWEGAAVGGILGAKMSAAQSAWREAKARLGQKTLTDESPAGAEEASRRGTTSGETVIPKTSPGPGPSPGASESFPETAPAMPGMVAPKAGEAPPAEAQEDPDLADFRDLIEREPEEETTTGEGPATAARGTSAVGNVPRPAASVEQDDAVATLTQQLDAVPSKAKLAVIASQAGVELDDSVLDQPVEGVRKAIVDAVVERGRREREIEGEPESQPEAAVETPKTKAAPLKPDDALRSKFSEVLAGPLPRSRWARALGANPEQMAALEKEAIKDKRLRKGPRKTLRRTAKAKTAAARPQGRMPGHDIGSVSTPDGAMSLAVRTEIVEHSDLKAQTKKGALQPRDRTSKASQDQVRERAQTVDVARLMPRAELGGGAPIVLPDGTVLSGNGRVLALGAMYGDEALKGNADAYRAALGPEAAAFKQPVIIQRVLKPPSQADLKRFAELSNARNPYDPGVEPATVIGSPENMAAREAAAREFMRGPEWLGATMSGGRDTSLVAGYGTHEWKRNRVYRSLEGEDIYGYEAAIAYLIATAEAAVPGGIAYEKKAAAIVIGYPGAGKSKIADPLSAHLQAVQISSDNAKPIIPEYEGGWNSAGAHEEASKMMKDVLDHFVDRGANIILEKLGSVEHQVTKPSRDFHIRGYSVMMLHVDVPKAVAMERAIKRFRETGRAVPLNIYDTLKAGDVYAAVKMQGAVDETAVVKWNEPEGWVFVERAQSLDGFEIPAFVAGSDGAVGDAGVDGAGGYPQSGAGAAGGEGRGEALVIASRADLERTLAEHGIDKSAYGKGEAKTVDNLYTEINDGESELFELADGSLVRRTSILSINVFADVNGERQQLKEDRQEFSDGRVRRRSLPRSLSEKLKAGEGPDQTIGRALQEELGVNKFRRLGDMTASAVNQVSQSYPQLRSEITAHGADVLIDPSEFNAEGYTEVQSEKTNFFVWGPDTTSEPQLVIDPLVRVGHRAREIEDRTGRVVGQATIRYADQLEAARGNPVAFAPIYAQLIADRLFLRADVLDLAELVGVPQKAKATKNAALELIRQRHQDHVQFLAEQEAQNAIERELESSAREISEGDGARDLQDVAGERVPGRAPGRDGARGGRAVPGPGGTDGQRSGAAGGLPGEGEVARSDTAEGEGDGQSRADLEASLESSLAADRDAERQARADRARKNYRITDEDAIGSGGAKAKVRGNIEALRTLKKIEDERREASQEEKAVLVKYVGWGAFSQDVFAGYNDEWKKERAALVELMSPDEITEAKRSTLNAHYTSAPVIKGVWAAMQHLGFTGGRAIEPSVGIGHFIGLAPEAIHEDVAWTAVDLDGISGRITKALYGAADVRSGVGYETQNWPDAHFDLAISNVPFGDYKLRDTRYPEMLIHDYFFVKSLDKVRPGGLVAFITSAGTLDKVGSKARREIAKRGTFLGAIRLPGGTKGAFKANAGTDVTTDIIFLRRRVEGEPAGDPSWLELEEIKTPEGPTKINKYFADNPDMMLGKMRLVGTRYAKGQPELIGPTDKLDERIAEAAKSLPANAFLERGRGVSDLAEMARDDDATGELGLAKEGAFYTKDGKLFRKVQGVGTPVTAGAAAQGKIRAFMQMRDLVNRLLRLQSGAEAARGNVKDDLRASLGTAYDAFVAKHGPVNKTLVTKSVRKSKDLLKDDQEITIRRRPNFSLFADDPDAYKVAAIEMYDEETGTATKSAIFSEDIVGTYQRPEITGPADAMAVSLNERGKIDIPFIAGRLGLSEKDTIGELGEHVYLDPVGETWRTRDAYLAGDVVAKLEAAELAAKLNNTYERNVEALRQVLPEPLTRAEITIPAGAPWVPAEVYEEFVAEVMGVSGVRIESNEVTKKWQITNRPWFPPSAETEWGTGRVDAKDVLVAMLNSTLISVTEKDAEGNTYRLPEEEAKAMARVYALRERFMGNPEAGVEAWVWLNDDRAARLEQLYNRSYNRLAPERYDGSHLSFPGLARVLTFPDGSTGTIDLLPHRVNAIWRIIQNGNTLLDHFVGGGKTWSMIMSGMEQKRLGLIQRPMYVVPNHMLEQFSTEFLQAYPGAKLLVATKDHMSLARRKEFSARVASEKWDGIIITHDAFGRIRMSDAAMADFYQSQIDEIVDIIERQSKERGGRDITVKEMEKRKLRLKAKLEKLTNVERKDAGVVFEELGVDFLYIDEAHCFPYMTHVLTDRGLLPIGDIVENRLPVKVASYDHRDGTLHWKPVHNFWRHERGDKAFVTIHTDKYVVKCTSNHQVYVHGRGYVDAKDIEPGETLRALREDVLVSGERSSGQSATALLAQMRGCDANENRHQVVHAMRNDLHVPQLREQEQSQASILRQPVRSLVAYDAAGPRREIDGQDARRNAAQVGDGYAVCRAHGARVVGTDAQAQSHAEFGCAGEDARLVVGSDISGARRQRATDCSTTAVARVDRTADGVRHTDETGARPVQQSAQLLQGRFGGPAAEAGDRGGWQDTHAKTLAFPGQAQDGGTERARVVRVEVHQCGSDGEPRASGGHDRHVYDLGIEGHHNYFANGLLVHNSFKNLPFFTQHTRIKGIANSAEAQRSVDLFVKMRHLEKSRPGRSAVFATGTPVSNTMAELYTMQRYLQNDLLKDYGIAEFDAWAATFGQIVAKTELVPENPQKTRTTSGFWRFVNIPELMALASRSFDTQTADMLKLPRPKLKNGKVNVVESNMSGPETDYMQGLVARAEKLRSTKVDPEVDNMLKIVSEGRKVATDMRLIDHGAEFNPNGKVAKAVDNIFRIWKEGKDPALGQIVFLDMGVPGSKGRAAAKEARGEPEDRVDTLRRKLASEASVEEAEEAAEADVEASEITAGLFNLYEDIRTRLVAKGMPRAEIAFIHEAKGDDGKARMFAAVRDGKIRVIIGSTGKMGVGTNIQKRLIAMHHIDAPWKPAEVEQRDGRIIRQGNKNAEVEMYRYVTRFSFDAYMWQTLERKAAFIAQLKAGAKGLRVAEDIDSPLPEAADIKAAAAGDPRILRLSELERAVNQLEVARRAHVNAGVAAKSEIARTEADIVRGEKVAELYRRDLAKVSDLSGDNFAVTLDLGTKQVVVKDRKKAGEAMRAAIISFASRSYYGGTQEIDLGTLSGFGIAAKIRRVDMGVEVTPILRGETAYSGDTRGITEDSNPVGIAQRFENMTGHVAPLLRAIEEAVAKRKADLPRLVKQAEGSAFPRQVELTAAKTELAELTAELSAEKAPSDVEVEEQVEPADREMASLIGRAPPREIMRDPGFNFANLEARAKDRFGAPDNAEFPVAAAIRYGDTVVASAIHGLAEMHAAQIGIAGKEAGFDGFLTNTGRFISRSEAARITERFGVRAEGELESADLIMKLDPGYRARLRERRGRDQASLNLPQYRIAGEGSGRMQGEIVVDGKIVGRANVRDRGEFVQLGDFNVEPEFQRRGLGTGLQRHVEETLGKPVRPDSMLSESAYRLWLKTNPAEVADFQKGANTYTPRPGSKSARELYRLADEADLALAPAITRQMPDLVAALEGEIRKNLPPDVAVRVSDRLFTLNSGALADAVANAGKRLIRISLAYGEVRARELGRHETIHMLRELGLFTDAEWTALVRRAHKIGAGREVRLAEYRQLYRNVLIEEGYEGAALEAELAEMIDQELVAKMAESYVSEGIRFGATIDGLLERILQFLDAVAKALERIGITQLSDALVGQSGARVLDQTFAGGMAERPTGERASGPLIQPALSAKARRLDAKGTAAQWINVNERAVNDWQELFNAGLSAVAELAEAHFQKLSSDAGIAEVSKVGLANYLKRQRENPGAVDPQVAAALDIYDRDPEGAVAMIEGHVAQSRKRVLEGWRIYLTQTNADYAADPFWRDYVWAGLIKPLRNDGPNIPPPLLPAALGDVYLELSAEPDSRGFETIYAEAAVDAALDESKDENKVDIGDTKTWVKVPRTSRGHSDFQKNVDLVRALSCKTWCTSGEMAAPYLEKGDFWMLTETGHTRMAIRFEGDNVVEIQGPANNGRIPAAYADDVRQLMQSGVKMNDRSKRELAAAYERADKIAAVEKMIAAGNHLEAFRTMGVEAEPVDGGGIGIRLTLATSYNDYLDDFSPKAKANLLASVVEATTEQLSGLLMGGEPLMLPNLRRVNGSLLLYRGRVRDSSDFPNLEEITLGFSTYSEPEGVRALTNLRRIYSGRFMAIDKGPDLPQLAAQRWRGTVPLTRVMLGDKKFDVAVDKNPGRVVEVELAGNKQPRSVQNVLKSFVVPGGRSHEGPGALIWRAYRALDSDMPSWGSQEKARVLVSGRAEKLESVFYDLWYRARFSIFRERPGLRLRLTPGLLKALRALDFDTMLHHRLKAPGIYSLLTGKDAPSLWTHRRLARHMRRYTRAIEALSVAEARVAGDMKRTKAARPPGTIEKALQKAGVKALTFTSYKGVARYFSVYDDSIFHVTSEDGRPASAAERKAVIDTLAGEGPTSPAANRELAALTGYHGSGAEIERFEWDKIGGVGGSTSYYTPGLHYFAFGHNFASEASVAQEYWKQFASYRFDGVPEDIDNPRHMAADMLRSRLGDRKEAAAGFEDALAYTEERRAEAGYLTAERSGLAARAKVIRAAIEHVESGTEAKVSLSGGVYEAEIDVEAHELLDLDAPVSEQNDKVQAVAAKVKPDYGEDFTGRDLIDALGGPSNPSSSETLRSAGIPGVMYADVYSETGTGTPNYVIFDDTRIKITAKENKPLETAREAYDAPKDRDMPSLAGTGSLIGPLFGDRRSAEEKKAEGDLQRLASKIEGGPVDTKFRGATQPGTVGSLQSIIADIKTTLGMSATQGRYGLTVTDRTSGPENNRPPRTWRFRPQSGLRGQYDRSSGVARYRLATDIDAIAHEGGHHLERKFGPSLERLKGAHRAELAAYAYRNLTAPATDAPAPQLAPNGFSGVDLDSDTQRILVEAATADQMHRMMATVVGEEKKEPWRAQPNGTFVRGLTQALAAVAGDRSEVTTEFIKQHFFDHNGRSYFVVPNMAVAPNGKGGTKSLAMNQTSGVFVNHGVTKPVRKTDAALLTKAALTLAAARWDTGSQQHPEVYEVVRPRLTMPVIAALGRGRQPTTSQDVYEELQRTAAAARGELVHRLGSNTTDALIADVVANAAGFEGGPAYVQNRFSATGVPKPPAANSPQVSLSEGFAEFFREYITHPDNARTYAPKFHEAFEDFLDVNGPDLLQAIERAQLITTSDAYAAYLRATTIDRGVADLVSNADLSLKRRARDTMDEIGQGKTISGAMSRIYQAAIDEAHPFYLTTKALLERLDAQNKGTGTAPVTLAVHDNPYKLMRSLSDSFKTGLMWIQNGMPHYRNVGGQRSASLHDALQLVMGNNWNHEHYQHFGLYLESRRAIEEWKRWEAKRKEQARLSQRSDTAEAQITALRAELAKLGGKSERRVASRIGNATLLADYERALQRLTTREADEVVRLSDAGLSDPARRDGRTRLADIRRQINAYEGRRSEIAARGTKTDQEYETITERIALIEQAIAKREGLIDQGRRSLREMRETGLQRPPHRVSQAEHEERVRSLERDMPNVKKAAAMVYDFLWQQSVHEFEAGIISKDVLDYRQTRRHFYVPFARDLSDIIQVRGFGGRKLTRQPAKPYTFEGSDRPVVNPIETIVDATFHMAAANHWNEVQRALVRLADMAGPAGGGEIAERVSRQEAIAADAAGFKRLEAELIAEGYEPEDAERMVRRVESDFGDHQLLMTYAPEHFGAKRPLLMSFYENGERQYLRINDPEFAASMHEAVNGLGREMAQLFMNALAVPATVLRAGTTMNPAFIIPNIARDMWAAWILTGTVMDPRTWPVMTQARGLYHELRQTDMARLYQEVGGLMGGQNVAALSRVKDKSDVMALKTQGLHLKPLRLVTASALGAAAGFSVLGPAGGVFGSIMGAGLHRASVNGGLRFFETLSLFSDLSETATRMGVFTTAYKGALKYNPGLTPYQAAQEAAYVARDLIDFGRRGSRMLAAARLVPFLNANIQGLDKAARQALTARSDRGAQIAVSKLAAATAAGALAGGLVAGPIGAAITGAAMPAVALEMAKRSDAVRRLLAPFSKKQLGMELSKDDERALADSAKAWAHLLAYTLILLAFRLIYGDDDEYKRIDVRVKYRGQPVKLWGEWYQLPKAFEWAIPSNIIEAAMDHQLDGDPRLKERILDSLYENMAPPATPQAGRLWADLRSNYNSRTGRPIVPEYDRDLPPQEQFNAYTSQGALWLARAIQETPALKAPADAVGHTLFGPHFELSPAVIDYALSTGLSYWGRDIQKLSNVGSASGAATGRPVDFPILGTILQRISVDPNRSADSLAAYYELMRPGAESLTRASAGYDKILGTRGQTAANQYLATVDENQRAYALAMAQSSTYTRRAHPLVRLQGVMAAVSSIEREIVLERLEDTAVKGDPRPIPLGPHRAAELRDILAQIKAIEAGNTMTVLGIAQFANRVQTDVAPALALLKASSPEVYEEYETRLLREKVQEFADVAKDWPRLRAELLADWQASVDSGGEPLPSPKKHRNR